MRHGEFLLCGLEAEHTTGSSEEAKLDYDLDLSYFGTFAKARRDPESQVAVTLVHD